MPLQATSGAASYDAFGGGVAAVPKYIEDYFSTFLYTGNNTSQTITNGIDLATKGGLVWIKSRAGTYVREHYLYDTARGTILSLSTDTTGGNVNNSPNGVSAYNTTGFDIVGSLGSGGNGSGTTYTSWSWAKAPKFFDVVTYTGNGTAGRTVSHNLGSTPACMIVKDTTNAGSAWAIYHTSLGNTQYLQFTTSAAGTSSGYWNNTTPTSTEFTVGTNGNVNLSGATYVAYLFAHNAGGFGLTGTDNVISCGSFTSDGSSPISVNLGYEPQWVLVKASTAAGYDWWLFDNMRGTPVGSGPQMLRANTSGAETTSSSSAFQPNATGFTADGSWLGASTFIYIAIRRGPMKVPTSGTSVFKPLGISPASTSSGVGFPADMSLAKYAVSSQDWLNSSRLTNKILYTNSTGAEDSIFGPAGPQPFDTQDGFKLTSISTTDYAFWAFKRAPSFFDEVCYTGTGVTHTETHNLGVAPELIIVKRRASATASWAVYAAPLTASYVGFLDLTNAFQADNMWNSTAPTSTAFTVRAANAQVNASGSTYVAYLFATCAGVSKVGSYTGTGTTKQIDCGFTGGARFVLIKRTDSTGDWYVWDSARGIVAGNDPYLLLNSTAAEVTNTDYVDTYSAGFEISSTAPAAINASGGTFIFLAIA